MRRFIVFALLCASCVVPAANAGDFLSRYDGTIIRLDWTTTHAVGSPSVSESSVTIGVSRHGIVMPGSPAISEGGSFQKSDGYGGITELTVDVHPNGFTYETLQRNGRLQINTNSIVTVTVSEDRCSATAVSDLWKAVVKCFVIEQPPQWNPSN